MSLEDILREEVQRQIDIVLEDIEYDYSQLAGPNIRSRWDFVYGFEVGCIQTATADYYRYKIMSIRSTKEEARYIADQINAIVTDRLPEIRQAISRAEAKLQ